MDKISLIKNGKTALGIELGSTRIKGVLTAFDGTVLAEGGSGWENRLENGIWTYSLEDIHGGIRACYKSLAEDVSAKYGVKLNKIGAIGISAMMHGYMAFDENDRLLVPFRTWRNGITEEAADKLSELLNFNIPQRWSIAHLYQAILNKEEHIKDVKFITTLAGYIHYRLTGEKVLGVGDASGMFPISDGDYDKDAIAKVEATPEFAKTGLKLNKILPKVLSAGENAGSLTKEGAAFLDPTGELEAGIALAPPEGDAGTGMAATNSVAVRTGNVSAGTSVFSMVVLEKPLQKLHREIDIVTTPAGLPVAMVHVNNCTSDINAWTGLIKQALELFGLKPSTGELYDKLFKVALDGRKDCGGLVSYGYISGENITGCPEGRPMLIRKPDSALDISDFMRTHLYSACAALKIGMDILTKEENVKIDTLLGHGGFFKTEKVGQSIMAAALETPVAVTETAGEGGPWGMALLASYRANKAEGETLEAYLADKIFAVSKISVLAPDPDDVKGFSAYIDSYKKALSAEKAAIENY